MKPKITQAAEKEVPIEVLAEAIVSMAQGVRKLRSGRLNDRALVLLIQHAAPNVRSGRYSGAPVTSKQVRAVLDGIDALETEYLKKKQ